MSTGEGVGCKVGSVIGLGVGILVVGSTGAMVGGGSTGEGVGCAVGGGFCSTGCGVDCAGEGVMLTGEGVGCKVGSVIGLGVGILVEGSTGAMVG